MKPIFLAFFSILLFASCSSSDSSSQPFFNLSNGNLWVYKTYHSSDNVNYTFINRIDSVRVTGDTLIAGINFAKLQHKIYNSGVFENEMIVTLRVDSSGHLVNENNFVYHPGTDFQYQHVRDVLAGGVANVGSITEQLLEPFTTNVEGTDYFVYSYYGNFIPNDPAIPNNYIFSQYKEGLGLVCDRIVAVSGSSSIEDRLVYYELN